jgi:hypothetical protein
MHTFLVDCKYIYIYIYNIIIYSNLCVYVCIITMLTAIVQSVQLRLHALTACVLKVCAFH